ncbi:MAG: hypothetical protein IT410_04150 [Candidatus Doudnabacteria bacterium]|nr:hypothetical protein [Candidatus Doudnabacteria bacterium]
MEISKAQENLKSLLSRVAYPRIGTIIGLQEEVGKLSKVIMDIEIYNRELNKAELDKRCANVFVAVMDMCNSYDIDLELVIEKRIEEVNSKIKMWESQYGEELRNKRERFDE